ncbi:MAG: ABC transporter substrate-binding protein [Chloroflexi bacterium]|nr:MAG: ABC transporter substrate-binding protein [Chloroflexota bacterium]
MLRRLAVIVLILLMAIPVLSGISAAQEEKVLVIGHAESTDSLDPARGYTQTTGFINRATYQTLVTFPDEDASAIIPMLATEWTVSEDGLTYTFTLRNDAVFSSGNPLTAADVAFSLMRLKNIQGSPAFLAANIESVTAVDDTTVEIKLIQVDPALLANLANSNGFSIVDSTLVRENGGTDAADASTADTAEAFLNGTSAGTGPYMLERWDPQVETVLVRNPNYVGEAPYFDRVIITNIPEPATQKIALEAGDIDLALDLTTDQIDALEGNADIAIYSGPANIHHFLLMNRDPEIGGPVSDPLVAHAIRLALDYEGYLALWGGVQPASDLAVGVAGALGPDQAIQRDLDQARALLAEAGYPDGFEIEMKYPDFTFQGVNMNTNAQKIQADLAEVGIEVSLTPQELQVSLEEYRNGQQGFGYWFWGPDFLDPADFIAFLPGGKVAAERANWTAENGNPDMVALVEQARVETDQAARLDMYAQLQLMAQEDSAFAPFNQPDIQTAFLADIQGYVWLPQWLIDVALLSRSE